ncbi:nuclear transport factor 2 family protein [Nocardia pseudobrasiliensis]|uniref:Ketosteroid isomerase-like protein n=1 Tax=Nocardia pseudobrasiliensis TaxID=45979 RepID=A0A370HPY5_9NOCA|nr:nuclear transport factor 2 family protein [Nocardia pseudobrasiliensis]RDI60390.1 ketosteroid isomerase-like protein [Nocardia pseudobrasiliensis]
MSGLPEHPNVDLAVRYHRAVADGAVGPELAAYFHPEVVQYEMPNPFAPIGARRDLAAILAAAERGRGVVADQRFEFRDALVDGDRVVLETTWTATLAVKIGALAAGTVLRADIAAVLVFRDGLIVEQRNYDCYHPMADQS